MTPADFAAARKEADNPPCETPLLDLLRNVPTDARAVYEHHPTSHSLISYGSLCQRAADEIERLRSLLAATPEPTGLRRTRAYRLLERGVPFLVVREDEPYAPAVIAMIRAEEQRKGTWTKEDGERFKVLLAGSPEPAPNVCEKCGYVGPVIEHPHCNYLAGRIGDWPPEPAPALPDEVREAAEMLNLTIRMRETKHSCADRACSNVALGALNLLAALGGRS